jgi:hypothetical protein
MPIYLGLIDKARGASGSRPSRWALTWAEEALGGPTEDLQLAISGCPLRFNFGHCGWWDY